MNEDNEIIIVEYRELLVKLFCILVDKIIDSEVRIEKSSRRVEELNRKAQMYEMNKL